MALFPPVRHKQLSREELEARQKAREERIEKATHFPWRRFFIGLVMAILAVVVLGGGVLSLVIASLIVAYFSIGLISKS